MQVDQALVQRVARLARIKVTDEEAASLVTELSSILSFIEQLNEVDTKGVEPLTSVEEMEMKKRDDVVNDGGYPDQIVANAPMSEDHYFMVPKVVE